MKISKSKKCRVCGKEIGRFTHHKKQEDETMICGSCLGEEESEHQTQLPKPDQPLICAFQRRFNNPYRVQCAVTAIGDGGIISRAFANYESCRIDICPMYQNWQQNKKIISWLEMER